MRGRPLLWGMLYRILADLVVLVHLAFVGFVVLGGLLALRWPRWIWVHLPAAGWGILIEVFGWICPLTPLENELRRKAGRAAYEGGFVEHYVLPVLYPADLTREVQWALAAVVLVVNAVVYGVWIARRRSTAGGDGEAAPAPDRRDPGSRS